MTSTPSSSAMSPVSDMGSDEGRVRPISYLAHIAGCTGRDVSKDRETDLIMLDHCYSKPWNAHPEASHARPARTLFMSKFFRNKAVEPMADSKYVINLEGENPKHYAALDLPKAQGLMNECHRHVNLIRMEEGQDDWEDQLNRVGLTPSQNRLFSKVLKILHLLRLACLACAGRHDEPIQRRIHVDKAAKRMRQTLSQFSWETKLMQWLHATLMDFLNSSYLAAYFDILQTLKSKVPSLIDKMIAIPTSSKMGSSMNDSLNLLLKRPWDPAASGISLYKPKKLPGSPLLLIVASGPPHFMTSYSRRSLFWNSHLSCLGKTISLSLPSSNNGSNVSVTQCLELMISTVRNKVTEIQSHSPNRPIVLIGWNIGSLIACHVSLMENVSAVVCLGFPVLGINGGRGDVDDPLLESKTPTLFVIGQNSSVCNQDDLEEMREKMKTETSLVIVGGADENLCLCWTKKKMEGITQSMLDRCLLDEISDFLGTVLTRQPIHTPDNSCTSANSSDSSSCRDRRRRPPKAIHEDASLPVASMKRKGGLMVGSRQADWIKRKKRWPHLKNQGTSANKHPSLQKNANSQTKAELGKRQLAFNSSRRRRNQNLNSPVTNRKQPMWPSVDSFSSDSSNQSQQSTNQMSGSEIGSEESQGAGEDELISGKHSSSNSARGICLNIGSLSSLGQLRQKSSQSANTQESSYNYQSSYLRTAGAPATSTLPTETTTSRSKGSRMKARPTSAFLSVQKSSSSSVLTSSPVMSSILSSNPSNAGSMLIAATSKSVEPDQQQVQAIQKLQFHDFPLTTASLTKTGIGGGPVITQAKILSNINKLQGLITTTTATTGLCQSLLPGIPSVTTTTTATQSLLTSTASAFVSRQFVMGKSFTSTSGIASPKQGATSLLIGKNNRTSSSPSVKLQFPTSASLPSNPEIALLMVAPDSEIEALESELAKDLNDVSGNNENLLDIIRDITESEGTFEEGTLAAIPEIAALAPGYCSLLSENSGTQPISELDKNSEFANLAITSDFQTDDILETDSAVEENSLLPVVLRPTLDGTDANQLNPEDNQFNSNSVPPASATDSSEPTNNSTPFVTFGRAHRLSYPTVATTRTRRIRMPKYFDA